MSDDVRDFLDESSGSRFPGFKFDEVGKGVKGRIIEKPRVVERPNLNDGALEKQLVIALQPDEGEPVSVWVRKGFLAQAVSEAIAAAGAAGLEVGGELAVQHHDTQPAKTAGHHPAKLFRAKYTPPVASSATKVDASMFD